jgi:hypothetical protein
MKTKLSLTAFILFIILSTQGFTQDLEKPETENKLSLGIQSGFTMHIDYLAKTKFSDKVFGVNYFEFLIGFKFTDKIEAGISLGQDEFTYQGPSVSRNISFSPPDTTYDTTTFTGLSTYTWGAANINYYFNNDLFAGIKGGYDGRFNAGIAGINFGTQLISSKYWGLNALAQFMTRFGESENITTSYQINLLINVRFKPDLSRIF